MTNGPNIHELYDAVIDGIRDNAESLSDKDFRNVMREVAEIMNNSDGKQ